MARMVNCIERDELLEYGFSGEKRLETYLQNELINYDLTVSLTETFDNKDISITNGFKTITIEMETADEQTGWNKPTVQKLQENWFSLNVPDRKLLYDSGYLKDPLPFDYYLRQSHDGRYFSIIPGKELLELSKLCFYKIENQKCHGIKEGQMICFMGTLKNNKDSISNTNEFLQIQKSYILQGYEKTKILLDNWDELINLITGHFKVRRCPK